MMLQEGDIWVKAREAGYRGSKPFAVWVRRDGAWEHMHEAWGLVELRIACDTKGLVKVESRPRDATYTGIYRYEPMEQQEEVTLDVAEAFDVLRQGHGILAPEDAERICAIFAGVTLDPKLVMTWANATEALAMGFYAAKEGPGRGVGVLELGYSILAQLGIEAPGRVYTGKGFQAKANVEALATWVS